MHFANPDLNNHTDRPIRMKDPPFRLRSYQAELVDESLKSNIIVVMDTGSGKTHVAIDRARIELDNCAREKLVWFLAPTVTLCEQQHEVFKSYLPGHGIQLLVGADGVDHWSEQSVWNAVLHNVRIVVSTHKVLLDALTHGFVQMSKIALLIFDEAHHCSLNHPANQIMMFYGRSENSKPAILGLSASPVMKAKAGEKALQQIERNLRAIARTPKLHRSELIKHVHKPQLVQISFEEDLEAGSESTLLASLERAYRNYDMSQDPYVVGLVIQQQQGYNVTEELDEVLTRRKTYCSEQLENLASKARAMVKELGDSATEWYLHQCMAEFEKVLQSVDNQLFDWTVNEKQFLLDKLRTFPFQSLNPRPIMTLDRLSMKVHMLLDVLVSERRNRSAFTGLVFVEQRVWITALAEILSIHPCTKGLFKIGTYVGVSQSNKRKADIANFPEAINQQTTIDDFRSGDINLILTTSVLEEGIDISNCHLVICFERPKNLKSFVQRRGRARKQESKYVIFIPEDSTARSPETWQFLEAALRQAYEDDARLVEEAESREAENESGQRYFEVPATHALLTLDNALSHLNHFCDSLGVSIYANPLPEFKYEQTSHGQVSAKVTLPIGVDRTLRVAHGLQSWRTEKLARKDAAYEAYIALYKAGLVNDNLLPLRTLAKEQEALSHLSDSGPSMVKTASTYDPWLNVAKTHQQQPSVWYRTLLEVNTSTEQLISIVLLMPAALPSIQPITLFWNSRTKYTIQSTWLAGVLLDRKQIQLLRLSSERILRSVFHFNQDDNDFLWLLAPCDSEKLSDWFSRTANAQSATEMMMADKSSIEELGLMTWQNKKFMVQASTFLHHPNNEIREDLQLDAIRFPKRRDFSRSTSEFSMQNDAYTRLEKLPVSECTISRLPTRFSIFALFFPSIIHKIEVNMIAENLCTTILKPLSFGSRHIPSIVTAITASATGEEDNYERLEFLGDTILKYIASVHLMAKNLTWPESYLTSKKGTIVSNGYLCRAALDLGLGRFIISKRFTSAKWKPRCVSQVLAGEMDSQEEEKTSKTVADIVESLIGASYLIGGLPKAFLCVQTLLRGEDWIWLEGANKELYKDVPDGHIAHGLAVVEELVGHTFKKKALILEALTHASYNGPNVHASYERLEFLGDAVLDYIITKRIFKEDLSQHAMHMIKSALVNGAFLAYCMFELTMTENITNKATMQPEGHDRALWQYLRTDHPHLIAAREAARTQHEALRDKIASALSSGAVFPWHLLVLADAPKFLSDIVESMIGAIYVDSCGDVSTCEMFVCRLGLFDHVDRIMRDKVDVTHPKVRLGILAVEKDVKYERVGLEDLGPKNMKKMYCCQVKVGGEKVGGIVEGLRRGIAETMAAWQAVAILDKQDDGSIMDTDEDDTFFDARES